MVTFLFTDVEGSTRRWEADADATGDVLDQRGVVQHEPVARHLVRAVGELLPQRRDPGVDVVSGPRLRGRVGVTAGVHPGGFGDVRSCGHCTVVLGMRLSVVSVLVRMRVRRQARW